LIKYLKVILVFLTILIIFNKSFGQNYPEPQNIRRQIIGITPSKKHRIISGLAIGLTLHPWSTWQDTSYNKLNGLNIEVGPLGIIGGIWGAIYGFYGSEDSLKHKSSFFSKYGYQDSIELSNATYGTRVNGISISLGGMTETYNNGLVINGLSGISYKNYGVQISGLLNKSYEFKGLMIAGISNKTTKGKGIQIGLINNCKTGQLLQIGLFNRIGNRVLPFINFRFKRDKKTTPDAAFGNMVAEGSPMSI
jgi:hypothetical protein